LSKGSGRDGEKESKDEENVERICMEEKPLSLGITFVDPSGTGVSWGQEKRMRIKRGKNGQTEKGVGHQAAGEYKKGKKSQEVGGKLKGNISGKGLGRGLIRNERNPFGYKG